jgi:hypothetical protein
MELWLKEENWISWNITCLSVTFSTINPKWTTIGFNPDLYDVNRLSYSMAIISILNPSFYYNWIFFQWRIEKYIFWVLKRTTLIYISAWLSRDRRKLNTPIVLTSDQPKSAENHIRSRNFYTE